MKLVMIGNGIAAVSAADSFRKYDDTSEITMLSEEEYPAYHRIKLSHYLGRPAFDDEELWVKSEAWYTEKKIGLKLGSVVKAVDFQGKRVLMTDGQSHSYDRLLLANGASPFVPPVKGAEKAGVFVLRTLNDLKRIRAWMDDKSSIVVIGGGLLGLEAAHGLLESGKKVTVVEFFDYLLPRQLDRELSDTVRLQLEAEGLQFSLGAGCEEILGESAVSGLRLVTGEVISADAVLFSAGVRPNVALFKDTELQIEKGVVVDARMETSVSGVYAAGDIAQCHGMVYGLWTASNEQGKVAGANLAGQEMTYSAPQLSASLAIGKVKLFSMGDVAAADAVVTYRQGDAFHRIFIKDRVAVGAVLTGDTGLMMKARKLVLDAVQVTEEDDGSLFIKLMG